VGSLNTKGNFSAFRMTMDGDGHAARNIGYGDVFGDHFARGCCFLQFFLPTKVWVGGRLEKD
jgi:hypothetical protein